MIKFVRIMALTFLAVSPALASTLEDKVQAFKDALKASASSRATSDKSLATPDAASSFRASFENEPNSEGNLQSSILRAMAMDPSPGVQEAGKALLAELEAEKKAYAAAIAAKVDAVFNGLSDQLSKAQKPEDLDAVLSDIHDLPLSVLSGGGTEPPAPALTAKINASFRFVIQWQDFLSAKNHENTAVEQSILTNLLNSQQLDSPNLIPRSRLLAESAALGEAAKSANPDTLRVAAAEAQRAKIIAGIKTLDDILPVLGQLSVLNTQISDNGEVGELTRYGSIYADAKNGLPVKFDVLSFQGGYNGQGADRPELSAIKSQLQLYVLPIYLNAGPEQRPQPNESVTDYLNRLLSLAETKNDWIELKKLTMIQQKLGYTSLPPEFFAGLDQETAGQYALATQSYILTLRANSLNLPTKLVGDRLDAIKRDHPDDYAEGMKRYLAPLPQFPWSYGMPQGTPFAPPATVSPPSAATSTKTHAASAPPLKPPAPPAPK
jgi:hypothetical protein